MHIARNLRLSVRALSTHRLRTALAVAGTAVGVAGVLVLTAIGEGARAEVIRQIESLGRNVIVIAASRVDSRAGRAIQGGGWTRKLQVSDAAAILQGTSTVLRAAPLQQGGMTSKYGPIQSPTTIIGTTPEWREIRQFELTAGRFFTADENVHRQRVAVIGSDVRKNLLPDSVNPLGRMIRIGRVPFQVVGVLVSKGVSVDGNASEDDRIIIPLETALNRLFNLDYLQMIYLEAASSAVMSEAQEEAAAILRVRHDVPAGGRDDFVIQNQRVLLETQLATQTSFQRLIMGLGFLSLTVGGVGILSIMLLSVRERRREIGLRVAVGARRTDIAAQFIAEALILAGSGGALGILLGMGLASIVSSATSWAARVSEGTLLVAIVSAVAIGVVFGVFPAWRAATMDPIRALQAE
jgi:putative ABC transport system permease protein